MIPPAYPAGSSLFHFAPDSRIFSGELFDIDLQVGGHIYCNSDCERVRISINGTNLRTFEREISCSGSGSRKQPLLFGENVPDSWNPASANLAFCLKIDKGANRKDPIF